MSTFTPPNTNSYSVCPPPGYGHPLARRLLRFYGSEPQGENVYILNNATVTTTDPDGETVKWSDVTSCFYGAHGAYTVTAAEAALLTGAGYTVDS